MVTLTRPDGTRPWDLHLSRRGLTLALTGGYAVAAWSAHAQPVKTDEQGLVTGMVQLSAPDRQIPAYLARPASPGERPAVVVVSEVFGLHEYVRDVARRLAKLGYVAIAPDFFVRAGDPSGLTEFPQIMKIVATATDEQVTGDLRAAVAFLGGQEYVDDSKLAITGFCWGGAVVWEAAARIPEFKAGAAWYGRLAAAVPPGSDPKGAAPIDLVDELKAPVLGLYAGNDSGIPLESVERMRAALKAAGKTESEIVVYPGAQHGFHADYRPSYDAKAAQDAWKRMLAFFAEHGVAAARRETRAGPAVARLERAPGRAGRRS